MNKRSYHLLSMIHFCHNNKWLINSEIAIFCWRARAGSQNLDPKPTSGTLPVHFRYSRTWLAASENKILQSYWSITLKRKWKPREEQRFSSIISPKYGKWSFDARGILASSAAPKFFFKFVRFRICERAWFRLRVAPPPTSVASIVAEKNVSIVYDQCC